jgi:hypothetical protein
MKKKIAFVVFTMESPFIASCGDIKAASLADLLPKLKTAGYTHIQTGRNIVKIENETSNFERRAKKARAQS